MKALRLVAAIAILFFAATLQFLLASTGIFVNILFATLIAFAFLFAFWEVFFFILIAIFIINWQPRVSGELVIFIVVPLVAFFIHKFFSWQGWAGNVIAIIFGTLMLYLVFAPGMYFRGISVLLVDLLASVSFGSAVFTLLNRREGR